MSFITTPATYHYPWYVRLIFALQRRRYGRELEPARLWGRLPRTFLALTLLFRTLERKYSPLAPGLRSLVLTRVSQLNWCAFCMDLNAALALKRDVDEQKLNALPNFRNSKLFDAREKAILAYTEGVTLGKERLDPHLLHDLREHLSDQSIIELTALIAYQNMATKFNSALGVEPQGFCEALRRPGAHAPRTTTSLAPEPGRGPG